MKSDSFATEKERNSTIQMTLIFYTQYFVCQQKLILIYALDHDDRS